MIRNAFVLAIFLAAALTGCTSGSLTLSSPGAELGVYSGGSGSAVHCPPGQAKKGNC